jgi:hypothetical protein
MMDTLHDTIATLRATADAAPDPSAAHIGALWEAIGLIAETIEPRNSM